jgi:hypothetical protein
VGLPGGLLLGLDRAFARDHGIDTVVVACRSASGARAVLHLVGLQQAEVAGAV